MAPEDSTRPFMRIPWAAALLKRPNIVTRVPGSRRLKPSGEDALFADILKTPRTLRSYISFYVQPFSSSDSIEEVSTLITLGLGLAGHLNVMHGGIVATVLDESMGILQAANYERDHMTKVGKGESSGKLPIFQLGFFTAEMKVKYLRPVRVPGALLVTAKYVKREGKKEWLYSEIKQREGADEDYDGDEIVCATAKALFIRPKSSKL